MSLNNLSPDDYWRVCRRRARYWLKHNDPDYATRCVRDALHFANRLSPAHRRATMRVLNWTRAAASQRAVA